MSIWFVLTAKATFSSVGRHRRGVRILIWNGRPGDLVRCRQPVLEAVLAVPHLEKDRPSSSIQRPSRLLHHALPPSNRIWRSQPSSGRHREKNPSLNVSIVLQLSWDHRCFRVASWTIYFKFILPPADVFRRVSYNLNIAECENTLRYGCHLSSYCPWKSITCCGRGRDVQITSRNGT